MNNGGWKFIHDDVDYDVDDAQDVICDTCSFNQNGSRCEILPLF
jgi:hypothetical protein